MKITRIEAAPIRISLKPERRMISALGKHDVSDFVLVVMHTDDGIFGLGEATVTPRWVARDFGELCLSENRRVTRVTRAPDQPQVPLTSNRPPGELSPSRRE